MQHRRALAVRAGGPSSPHDQARRDPLRESPGNMTEGGLHRKEWGALTQSLSTSGSGHAATLPTLPAS
eukprot:9405614-Pyramimonas_sp.AAC.1